VRIRFEFGHGHTVDCGRISQAALRQLNNLCSDKGGYRVTALRQSKCATGLRKSRTHRVDQFRIERLSPEKRCDRHDTPQKLLVDWNYDARYASNLNAPYFEAAAGDTFKGVEVARVALRLYSEQTHFNVANRAEKQRLDGRFRERLTFWKRADVSHGMRAFPDWLLCTFWCLRTCHLSRP